MTPPIIRIQAQNIKAGDMFRINGARWVTASEDAYLQKERTDSPCTEIFVEVPLKEGGFYGFSDQTQLVDVYRPGIAGYPLAKEFPPRSRYS